MACRNLLLLRLLCASLALLAAHHFGAHAIQVDEAHLRDFSDATPHFRALGLRRETLTKVSSTTCHIMEKIGLDDTVSRKCGSSNKEEGANKSDEKKLEKQKEKIHKETERFERNKQHVHSQELVKQETKALEQKEAQLKQQSAELERQKEEIEQETAELHKTLHKKEGAELQHGHKRKVKEAIAAKMVAIKLKEAKLHEMKEHYIKEVTKAFRHKMEVEKLNQQLRQQERLNAQRLELKRQEEIEKLNLQLREQEQQREHAKLLEEQQREQAKLLEERQREELQQEKLRREEAKKLQELQEKRQQEEEQQRKEQNKRDIEEQKRKDEEEVKPETGERSWANKYIDKVKKANRINRAAIKVLEEEQMKCRGEEDRYESCKEGGRWPRQGDDPAVGVLKAAYKQGKLAQACHSAVFTDVCNPDNGKIGSVCGALSGPAASLDANMHDVKMILWFTVADGKEWEIMYELPRAIRRGEKDPC